MKHCVPITTVLTRLNPSVLPGSLAQSVSTLVCVLGRLGAAEAFAAEED